MSQKTAQESDPVLVADLQVTLRSVSWCLCKVLDEL